MAGNAYVRKRLYNPELVIDTNNVLNNGLRRTIRGFNFPTYFIKWTGTPQAGEELGTAGASVKDGTTTPFQVIVVSSDVADKRTTAAGAVHSVALIGITVPSVTAYITWTNDKTYDYGRPRSTVEVIAMNGTADVASTRYYLWVDHAYACEWGTGATDATGNITVESPANTELLKITATYNESDGGVWHFPPSKKLKTSRVKMAMYAVAVAQDGVSLDGAFTGFEQTNNTDPDCNKEYYVVSSPGEACKEWRDCDISRYTTVNSKVLWTETLIANAVTTDIEIEQILV